MNSVNEEMWRPVIGYEGYYEVSSLGRVRSVDRYVNHSPGTKAMKKGRVLRGGKAPNGYRTTSLSKDGTSTTHSTHTLVASAYLGRRPDGHQVNHKDGRKENNAANNLEYVTPKENTRHSWQFGLQSVQRGTDCYNARITPKDVARIRRSYAGGQTQRSLAAEYKTSPANISAICLRRSWRHIA